MTKNTSSWNARLFAAVLLCIPFIGQACIGVAEDPRERIEFQDALPQELVHQIGSDKIAALLYNPFDLTSPGLMVEDLLYLLNRVNIPKMIRFVQQVDSNRILRLIYNLKRMGCNKANPALNILLPESYSRCSLNDYNHLDFMVSLINGTNNIDQLIEVINQNSFGIPGDVNQYLEKLAFLVTYIGGVEKVFELLNGIQDTRDIIYILDQLDPTLVAPASIAEIQNGSKLADMDKLLAVLVKFQDGNKIFELVNGIRPIFSASVCAADPIDTCQRAYLDNLIVLVNDTRKEVGEICPSDTAITTLASLVNNLSSQESLVNLIQKLTPATVADLINQVATGSQHSDAVTGIKNCSNRDDLEAGGKKLANVINEIAQTDDLIFIINNALTISALADLINGLKIGDAFKLGKLVNDITGPDVWISTACGTDTVSTNCRRKSTGLGKVVNLINFLAAGAPLVTILNDITDGTKLPTLMNTVVDSSNLLGLINAIIQEPTSSTDDLVLLLNTLDNSQGIPRLIRFVEELNPANETASTIEPSATHISIAGLLAQQTADINTSGIGVPALAQILNEMQDDAAVGRLLQLLNETAIYSAPNAGYNNQFTYNNATPNIPRSQGLVRLITFGATYESGTPGNPVDDVNFPGLGPSHIGVLLNGVTTANNLISILNATSPGFSNITDVIILVGCNDLPFATFTAPCQNIGAIP